MGEVPHATLPEAYFSTATQTPESFRPTRRASRVEHTLIELLAAMQGFPMEVASALSEHLAKGGVVPVGHIPELSAPSTRMRRVGSQHF